MLYPQLKFCPLIPVFSDFFDPTLANFGKVLPSAKVGRVQIKKKIMISWEFQNYDLFFRLMINMMLHMMQLTRVILKLGKCWSLFRSISLINFQKHWWPVPGKGSTLFRGHSTSTPEFWSFCCPSAPLKRRSDLRGAHHALKICSID